MLPRRLRRARAAFVAWLALALLVPAAGCGPGQGKVSGRVLYRDKPVPAGWLTFLPADPRKNSVTVPIGADGQYEATLPAGDVVITVDNREWQPRTAGPPPDLPPELKLPKGQTAKPKARAAPRQTKPSNYVPIPEKYARAESSGLRYTVKAGSQTHDVVLK